MSYLTEDEYIHVINPYNIRIANGIRPEIYTGDVDDLLYYPKNLIKCEKIKSGEHLIIYENDYGFFGVIGDTVVGYVQILNNESIDITVTAEYRRKGIGEKLLTCFRQKQPFFNTGGLSILGELTERKVYKIISNREWKDMSIKYEYTVQFLWTQGRWVGKRVGPANNDLQPGELVIEAYTDSQLPAIIRKEMQLMNNTNKPFFICNQRILSKVPLQTVEPAMDLFDYMNQAKAAK